MITKIIRWIFLSLLNHYSIQDIFVFPNRVVIVFNNEGKQVPALQGRLKKL